MRVIKTGTKARKHGLFGWACFNGLRDIPEAVLSGMEKAFNSNLKTSAYARSGIAAASTGKIASLISGGCVATVGRPQWLDKEFQNIAEERGDAAALALAYTRHGRDCTSRIRGEFAFVIADPLKKKVLLCVDPFTRHPIYYALNGETIAFASSASAVLSCPVVSAELDPQGIYDYVYFHMVPAPGTIYKNVRKLQAHSLVEFDGSCIQVESYWQPRFQEHNSESFPTQKNQLRSKLNAAIKNSIAGQKQVGAFLSGGLDSSTVTGVLSEQPEISVEAFSIGFDAEGYDEMEYARLAANHFGVKHHPYYVTRDDVVEALPLIAASYDEPFGNSSALPALFCANLAREHGIDYLLAGDGGDELFAGNTRYAKQQVFEHYKKVPGFVKDYLINPATGKLANNSKLFGKANSYIRQATTSLPDRLQTYNFLHRHPASEVFDASFLGQVDTEQPLQLQRQVYAMPGEASTLNKMLFYDWQFTLADNDIRKVNQMCALAGIDVAYPMLDDALVDFSCSIPSHVKLKGKNLRAFYKKALTNWLPDQTINKSKQGFGLPFGVWVSSYKPLQEMAYDNLLALKKRNYFNPEFLDGIIDLHHSQHAAYYGELIWILTVFELWLGAHNGR